MTTMLLVVASTHVDVDVTVWTAFGVFLLTVAAVWRLFRVALRKQVGDEIMKRQVAGSLVDGARMKRVESRLAEVAALGDRHTIILSQISAKLENGLIGRLERNESKLDDVIETLNQIKGQLGA